MLEGGNPNARHRGKGLERATFCHGVELSYCVVTVRALTETIINVSSWRLYNVYNQQEEVLKPKIAKDYRSLRLQQSGR